jgi:hypothetical protein
MSATSLISSYGANKSLYASNGGAYVSPQIKADAVTSGLVTAGTVLTDTFVSNSIVLIDASIVGATTTAIYDFATHAAFPVGCGVMVQWNDGTQAPGGGVSGIAHFGLVGAGKVITFGNQGWSGSETGVTGVLVNGAGSVLNITITGKTTSTAGTFIISRYF